jgi:hypothetical protein
MTTTPTDPNEPARPTSYTIGSGGDIVRLPRLGNAELLVYVIAVIVAGIIALTTPEVDGWRFLWAFTLLTIGYVISRGLAKATRVLER